MKVMPYLSRSEVPAVGRLFEDFFNGFSFGDSWLETGGSWMPSVDILEKDSNLILRAELPGMTEKDIDLKLDGNILTLKGERKIENEDNKGTWHQIESCHGSFTRSFSLPENVAMEKISAEYKNGVLTVTLPQKPETKPREIPVAVH